MTNSVERPGAASPVPRSGESQAARALVLAGARAGVDRATDVVPRPLVPVGGVPMLERVLGCLEACDLETPIHVSAPDESLLAAAPGLAKRLADDRIAHHASRESPARSVADFLRGAGSEGNVLVTTADHPLLEPEMVRHFLAHAAAPVCDLAVGVVERDLFRAHFPSARRTFVPLADTAVSGANLFWFRSGAAGRAAEFWTRAEGLRKRPWRLVSLFGVGPLVRFLLGRLDLREAEQRASLAMGLRVRLVAIPFPEAAIDVDNAVDLALVRSFVGPAGASPAPGRADPNDPIDPNDSTGSTASRAASAEDGRDADRDGA